MFIFNHATSVKMKHSIVLVLILFVSVRFGNVHNRTVVKHEKTPTGKDEEEKETLLKTLEDEKTKEKLTNAAITLATILATVLGIANPVTSAGIGIGVAVLAHVISDLQSEVDNLWEQLEDRIELKIGQKLAQYHLEVLKANVFSPLNRRILLNGSFGVTDFKVVIDKSEMVFPQNFASLGWSYDLPLAMVYYLPYMVSAYQKMVEDGEQPRCALANEMGLYRSKVVAGMKEMMKKRYKAILADSWDDARVQIPCDSKRKKHKNKHRAMKKTFSRADSSKSDSCPTFDQLITYKDGATNGSFVLTVRQGGWHGNSWTREINKIRDETVEFLYKEIIEKINAYFVTEICLECECPEKIKKEEIVFNWPKECFGDERCLHPAGSFGEGFTWCYTRQRTPGSHIKCDRIDFGTCMPVIALPFNKLNILDEEDSRRKR